MHIPVQVDPETSYPALHTHPPALAGLVKFPSLQVSIREAPLPGSEFLTHTPIPTSLWFVMGYVAYMMVSLGQGAAE